MQAKQAREQVECSEFLNPCKKVTFILFAHPRGQEALSFVRPYRRPEAEFRAWRSRRSLPVGTNPGPTRPRWQLHGKSQERRYERRTCHRDRFDHGGKDRGSRQDFGALRPPSHQRMAFLFFLRSLELPRCRFLSRATRKRQ